LLSNTHPRINYHLIQDKIEGNHYIIVAVELSSKGPYQTSEKAQNDKNIKLKAGRYIRINRDSKFPNPTEEFELLKKFTDF
jgi:ATP-dependent DNA helicase RecG